MLLRRLSFGRAQCWAGVFYVPDDAETIQLDLVDTVLATSEIAILLRPISRPTAALLIALRHPFKLLRASLGNLSGRHGRIREALSSIAVGTAPTSYRDWIALFDNWQPHDHARLLESPRRASWPSIGVCVFAGATDTGRRSTTSQRHADLLRATEKSLLNQSLPCPYRIAGQAGNTGKLETTLVHLDCEYVALLQAGEILPRQALALLADQAVSLGRPLVICADEDELTRNGVRCNPLFKPAPNHALMLSGTLSRGIWLVRRDVLLDHAGEDVRWAEILRLDIWLRLYQHGMAEFDAPGTSHPDPSPARRGSCPRERTGSQRGWPSRTYGNPSPRTTGLALTRRHHRSPRAPARRHDRGAVGLPGTARHRVSGCSTSAHALRTVQPRRCDIPDHRTR